MSEFDDIDGDGGPDLPEPLIEAAVAAGALCLACGGTISGPYCATCGQKNDDLRRSSFILAKDFFRDTFGFDSRMWRTLRLLAIAPGVVPKNYAHGKRSRFTPPVRLFLVVSFLFFVIIGLTNTLFVALDVMPRPSAQDGQPSAAEIEIDGAGGAVSCDVNTQLRFFVKEKELSNSRDLLERCFSDVQDTVKSEIAKANAADTGAATEAADEASEAVDRAIGGMSWAVANPRAFNDSFNVWLPRVLFLMTPVLALILALFIRGRDALLFDHLVLSFYSHAAGFALIGASLILAQFGAPYMGLAAFAAIAVYYFAALKRAYGRGWIKTVWTAIMSGFLYLIILLSIVMVIVSKIVWTAAA